MIAPATKSTLRVSCASRNGSLKPMMLKAAESRVCRYETTWAIARPPSELSSGMNRSEEHTSELQSLAYLVCRLLLEKKKKKNDQDVRCDANQQICGRCVD